MSRLLIRHAEMGLTGLPSFIETDQRWDIDMARRETRETKEHDIREETVCSVRIIIRRESSSSNVHHQMLE